MGGREEWEAGRSERVGGRARGRARRGGLDPGTGGRGTLGRGGGRAGSGIGSGRGAAGSGMGRGGRALVREG